ncbi:MAG TPA: MFS transporter [Planctomycetota bacterium]|nr:MFS transporter [Planctomycetota bacterium]
MNAPARFRSFPVAARAFLGGAALLEIGHAFQYALQNLYVLAVGHDVATAGSLNMASAVAVVLTTLPSAWLYERLGPRRSLGLACLLNAVAIVGLACSRELLPLLLWSALTGAAYTLHRVVAAPLLVAVSQPHERTHLFQFEFAVHTLMQTLGLAGAGLLAGGLEGGALTEIPALRAALVTGAVLSLSGLIPYRRLPARVATADGWRSAWEVLQILRPSRWHLWARLALPHALVGLGAGLSIPFMNLYFTQRFGLDKAAMGIVMAAASATMTIGALVTPRVVSRVGLVRATILTEALSIPFFLLMALSISLPVAVAAYVLRSALMNLSQPLWRNLMMDITPLEWRAAVNGAVMLCWNTGWALSNHWGGRLIDASAGWLGEGYDGYALPMLLTIGTSLLAIAPEARCFWHYPPACGHR